MKIIDLLNKIANGEEYKRTRIRFFDRQNDYKDEISLMLHTIAYRLYNGNILLNDEVEIIEEKEMCHKCGKYPCEYNQTYCEFCLGISEEDKKIEKLEHWVDIKSWVKGNDLETGLEEQSEFNKNVYYKINEIIDYINKGDE